MTILAQTSFLKMSVTSSRLINGSEILYHVVLTRSCIKYDPNSEIDKIQICGTYDSLPAARTAAERCLFDVGYDKETFQTFGVQHPSGSGWTHGNEIIVYAVAASGETLAVSITTTLNTHDLKGNTKGELEKDLYHVVYTTVFYDWDECDGVRQANVLGSYRNYDSARAAACATLLSNEDGMIERSWAEYDVIPTGARDWKYGKDVIVHAAGAGGENVWVSVVRGKKLNVMKPLERTMRTQAPDTSPVSMTPDVFEKPPKCPRCGLVRTPSGASPENHCSRICLDIARERECPDTQNPGSAELIEARRHEPSRHRHRRHSLFYERAPQTSAVGVEELGQESMPLRQASSRPRTTSDSIEERARPLEKESHVLDGESHELRREDHLLDMQVDPMEEEYFIPLGEACA